MEMTCYCTSTSHCQKCVRVATPASSHAGQGGVAHGTSHAVSNRGVTGAGSPFIGQAAEGGAMWVTAVAAPPAGGPGGAGGAGGAPGAAGRRAARRRRARRRGAGGCGGQAGPGEPEPAGGWPGARTLHPSSIKGIAPCGAMKQAESCSRLAWLSDSVVAMLCSRYCIQH